MKKIVTYLIVFIIQCFSASAQEKAAHVLSERLQQHLKASPIEKVHLHLDKPHYIIGDEIWLKAYILNDANAAPSFISGVLYIDVIDQKSKLVKSLKFPMLNGVTWGSLLLPNNISGGEYTIFAYTEWMKNAGSAFFFKKELLIKNPLTSSEGSSTLTKKDLDVQFFPEGGGLVEELPSKVAFKATNEKGIGEKISGAIYDNDGIEVVAFQSFYLGMGKLDLTPQAGKTYYAKIKFSGNSEKTFTLPTAAKNGHQLYVNTSNSENFVVKVFTSSDLRGTQDLTMLIHHNGKVYLETKISTEKQIAMVPFKTLDIPSGIVTVTLLNQNNLPLCERIVFVNNKSKQMVVGLDSLATTYSAKSMVNVAFSAFANTKPIQGSFSISTTNTSLISADVDYETNIFSSLLLSSDLVGYIEKPNAYFTDDMQQNNERIDYLMLTQGWRKISWEKLIESKTTRPTFEAESQLAISGTLFLGEKTAAATKVSLISTGKVLVSRDTVTDQNGRFAFDKLNFNEGSKFIVKAITSNPHKVKFIMDSVNRFPLQTSYHFNIRDADTISNIVLQQYDQFVERRNIFLEKRKEIRNQLETVEVVGKINKASNSLNINGAGVAEAVFDADDLKYASSLNQFLEGRVAGIQLINRKYYLTRNGIGDDETAMTIYLDGAKVDDNFTLEDLVVPDIESIEILKSQAKTVVYGTADGVILITTKLGGGSMQKLIANVEATPGMLTISPKGFVATRKFYVPKYSAQPRPALDSRTTVFWEPNLITDKDGQANFSYSNGNVPGIHRMVIEGIDAEGNLARKVLTYEVK